jgi:hypothetical protein
MDLVMRDLDAKSLVGRQWNRLAEARIDTMSSGDVVTYACLEE